jgi:hypothetical protein
MVMKLSGPKARDTAKLLQWISIDSYLLSAIPLILIQPHDPENTVLIICERITLDFGFANEGQTYNTLQYSLKEFSPYPEFGFKAKHFNF